MYHVIVAGNPGHVTNYETALRGVGIDPIAATYIDSPAAYDGLLLPGGADIDPALFGEEDTGSREIQRELDDAQLRLCRQFAAEKKPILGICKGHQMLNVAFGGTVCQHIPTYLRHQWDAQTQRDQSHGSTCAPDCFLARIYGTAFPICSAHHQAIGRLASGFRVIQWSDDGVPEAMVHESLPVIGVQWHPERMCFQNLRPDTVDGEPVFRFFLDLLAGRAQL